MPRKIAVAKRYLSAEERRRALSRKEKNVDPDRKHIAANNQGAVAWER